MSCPSQDLAVACVSPVSLIPEYVFVVESEEGSVTVFQITATVMASGGEISLRRAVSEEQVSLSPGCLCLVWLWPLFILCHL